MNMKHAKKAAALVQAGVLTSAAALALGAGAAASAQSAGTSPGAQRPADVRMRTQAALPQADPTDTRVYVAERKIIRDSRSGKLRKPTRKETVDLVANLKTLLSPSTQDMHATKLASGGGRLGLQGRFGEVVIARPAADGSMETRCVSTMEEAAAFLGLRLVSGSAPSEAAPNNN